MEAGKKPLATTEHLKVCQQYFSVFDDMQQ